MPEPHDVYAEQLSAAHYGHPLYHPDPPVGESPVEIGDVGFIRDGSFFRLFSATKPYNDAVQVYGVPDGFEPLDLGQPRTRPNELEPGPLHSKSVCRFTADLRPSACVIQPLRLSRYSSIASSTRSDQNSKPPLGFSCTSTKGAVLVLETQMKNEKVVQDLNLDPYLRRHCLSWHDFAKRHNFALAFGDMILVTECSKTAGWSSSVYWDSSKDFDLSFSMGGFSIKAGSRPVGNQTMENKSTAIVLNRKSHPRPIDPAKVDQTVFIKSYRLGAPNLYLLSFLSLFVGIWNQTRGMPLDKHAEESSVAAQALQNDFAVSDITHGPISSTSAALALHATVPDFSPASALLALQLANTSESDGAIVHDDAWCFPTSEVSEIIEEYTKFYFDTFPSFMASSEVSRLPEVFDPYATGNDISGDVMLDRLNERQAVPASDPSISGDGEQDASPESGDGGQGTLLDMDGATDFLTAQVSRADSAQIQPMVMDWESYVVQASTAHRISLLEALKASGANYEIVGVCTRLIEIFSDFKQYKTFVSLRDGAAQDLLDLLQKIVGVAAGLEYLHNNGVIHGDLKCLNVLVTSSQEACLTGFGFSYVTDAPGIGGSALSSDHSQGDTPAPELLDLENIITRPTAPSDVWGFGMVCFEVFTGNPPFGDTKDGSIAVKISRGDVPLRPKEKLYLNRGMTDKVWDLMKDCWSFKPASRPTAIQVIQRLPSIQLRPMGWTLVQRPTFETSSGQADLTITNALRHLESV
ncbi:hypothetical protein DXG01_001988 [Tephrocybe rancida]|nr:hypothetical protein DXG01_001988 [Tephrocybe rancida]